MNAFYFFSSNAFLIVRAFKYSVLIVLLTGCSDPNKLEESLIGVWQGQNEYLARCMEYRENKTTIAFSLHKHHLDKSEEFDLSRAISLGHRGRWKIMAGGRLFMLYEKEPLFAESRFDPNEKDKAYKTPPESYVADLEGDILKLTYLPKDLRGTDWMTFLRVEACSEEFSEILTSDKGRSLEQ